MGTISCPDDTLCDHCHYPTGEDELDASHTNGVSSNADDKAGLTHAVSGAKAMPTPPESDSDYSPEEMAPPKLPDVATVLDTMRKRLEALNGPKLPRI